MTETRISPPGNTSTRTSAASSMAPAAATGLAGLAGARMVTLVSLGAAVACAVVYIPYVDAPWLVAWLAAAALPLLLVELLNRMFHGEPGVPGSPLISADLPVMATGMAWGLGAFLLIQPGQPDLVLPFCVALTGLVSLAAIAWRGSPKLLLTTLALAVGPLIVRLLFGVASEIVAALFIAAFAAVGFWLGMRLAASRGEVYDSSAVMPGMRIGGALESGDSGNQSRAELLAELERHKNVEKELLGAKQAAEAATMAKGEFLATMSHEIRTPLNGIIPLLDILLSTKLAADQKEYLVTAYQSARELLRIVDDILDFSKMEANKLSLESVGLNLKEVVESVGRLMEKSAEAKGLRLTVSFDPNVRLAVRGDPVRLRQVLTNLVSNAVKFTERGNISIKVTKRAETRTHNEILFAVQDTGIGIAPEAAAKLFQPFSQADASTTRIHGGTGLGLVICKRIVDLMSGKIGVKTELGRGSVFWFSLPLMKAVGDVSASRRDLNGARALIFSTEPALIRRVSGYFGMWGITFLQTAVAADALAKLRSSASMGENWAYDVLIVDLGTMRPSSIPLMKNVLKEAALDRVRLLFISGDEEVPAEIREEKRAQVMARQFQDADLRGALNRLLGVAEAGVSADAPMAGPGAAHFIDAPENAAAPAPAQPVHGHVLLVEDNPVNRQVAQRLLSLIGVSFDAAEHGKQALERLEQGPYDAILMDCMMPVLDGYAATRAIRRLESEGARKKTPIIAMTANAMAGDREKCLAAGMDDYMSKPLNRALIEQMLKKWLPPNAKSHLAAVRPPGAIAPPVAKPRPVIAPVLLERRAPLATPGTDSRSGPVLDQEVVRDLLDVMGDEFTDLVRVYLEDSPKSLALLENAVARSDLDGLISPSHSLKSTSANLGALTLSELAKRIEHGARQNNLGEPAQLVGQLQAEYARVSIELNKLLTSSGV